MWRMHPATWSVVMWLAWVSYLILSIIMWYTPFMPHTKLIWSYLSIEISYYLFVHFGPFVNPHYPSKWYKTQWKRLVQISYFCVSAQSHQVCSGQYHSSFYLVEYHKYTNKMTCKWFGPILLVLIGGAFCTEGKNLVGPKKTVEIVQNKNDNFYYNQTATMRERRHTNLILHVLENAGIDPDAGELRLTPGAECARVCHDNESPMICKFEFILEHYHTMGP